MGSRRAPKTRTPNRVSSTNLSFFLARAEQARAEGDVATLAHVRERCRRSAAAWQALADKASRSEHLREEEARRKADAGLVS